MMASTLSVAHNIIAKKVRHALVGKRNLAREHTRSPSSATAALNFLISTIACLAFLAI